jgi:hypothetical protein
MTVEYLVMAFPDGNVSDDIAPELAKLVDNQTIRILDVVFLAKDAAGAQHDGAAAPSGMISGGGPGGPGFRPSVAVTEEQVGRRPGEEGQQVGGDPVGQGGQEGVAGLDAGQDQQAAQAGLDDAETAWGEREQRDDSRGGVGQQHQGGPRGGPGGAQGGQQAAEVEAEAPGGQQERLPPLLAQHRPDRVTLGQPPLSDPAVTIANQPLVRSASRCRAKLQVKDASSAASAALNQIGLSVDRHGYEPSTAASFGSTR